MPESILAEYICISRQILHSGKKALPLPDREQQVTAMVGSFRRTSPFLAEPDISATVLLLQKFHCHAGERVSSEDPLVIQKILAHLDEKAASVATGMMPQCRAPPPTGLFV